MASNERKILLSFDVEEFDLPLEYGQQISMEEQFYVGKKGLDVITPLLNDANIQTTLFTTANFAEQFPDSIRQLAQQHEIASHTYYHSTFKDQDLLLSKLKLEEISGQKVVGLRMPRMQKVEMQKLKEAGYEYDSSINPTWLPGRYNNFHLSRTVYTEENIKRLPASVSPHLRIPLFWLAFKNLPYRVFKMLALQTLKKDGYLCLYFHPWEFVDINKYGLPSYVKRSCGEILLNKLNRLVSDLKQEGNFVSINFYLK